MEFAVHNLFIHVPDYAPFALMMPNLGNASDETFSCYYV